MFKIKKLIFLASVFFVGFLETNAQVSFGSIPPSFVHPKLKSNADTLQAQVIPVNFSVKKLKIEDEKQQKQIGQPPRVAEAIDVDLNMKNSGEWTTLPDGKRIWRLRIKADGALALLLSYKMFDIAEGDSLYIYNESKTQVLGAYTKKTNPKGGSFSTEMVAGDDLILEYLEAPNKPEKGNIIIDKVGYCYNNVTIRNTSSEYDTYSAGACMVNINCDEGADWQAEKKGVVRMLMYLTAYGGWYYCTGTMINNTAQDLKPYLLSAFHCYSGAGIQDLAKWQFYFHFESPGCVNSNPLETKTLVGCYFRVGTPTEHGSDGLLLELSQEVPVDWNVYFNGWDRRNQVVSGGGVGIHHPAGDLKKISTFNTYISDTWPGAEKIPGADQAHWNLQFVQTKNGLGVVEGGSSGSPLFDHDHLVIGTLTGGNSTCTNNTGYNMYGKLWYHWDQYGNSTDTQMKSWLDPIGSGAETLKGIFLNPAAPRITSDRDSLSFLASAGSYSTVDTVVVKGYNLTEPIISKTTLGVFQISADALQWSNEVNLPAEGDTLYVRYSPSAIGEHNDVLSLTNAETGIIRVKLVGSSCLKISIVDKKLPVAEIGKTYSFSLASTGSQAPYTYSVVSGSLPDGISMNSNGVFSGQATTSGIYNFTVSVTDAYGCSSEEDLGIYVQCYVVSTYPFVEEFDDQSMPSCWEQTFNKGHVSWIFKAGARDEYESIQTAYSGTRNVTFYDDTYDVNSTKLITPQFDFSTLKEPKLSFWYALPAWLGEQDIFRIYYRTSALNSWVLLKTYANDVPHWTKEEVLLPNSSSEYFIAFEGESHFGYGVLLDKVTVEEGYNSGIETNDSTIALDFQNPFTNTLALSWNSPVEGVSIYSLDGKKMYLSDNLRNKHSLDIHTQNWGPGIYLMNVTGGATKAVFKIIKK
ncbi:MAG: putative Ig domain-containing protein [Dysgonomonas sp.]